MRGKRAKQYRKLMHRYGLAFGFREPFQVLVDEQIIQDADRYKMDLPASLERTLQGKVKPMITQCSMRHLYTSSASNQALILKAKEFERRRCNHHTLENPLSSLECLSSVVDPKNSHTNKHRYAVASQDVSIRKRMRDIPGVPLVYISRSIMVLEPMTMSTTDMKERHEKGKLRTGLKQVSRSGRNGLLPVDEKNVPKTPENRTDELHDDFTKPKKEDMRFSSKRKRGVKGPNPLSVKKPKERNIASRSQSKTANEDSSTYYINTYSNDSDASKYDVDDEDTLQKTKRKRKRKNDSTDIQLAGS